MLNYANIVKKIPKFFNGIQTSAFKKIDFIKRNFTRYIKWDAFHQCWPFIFILFLFLRCPTFKFITMQNLMTSSSRHPTLA